MHITVTTPLTQYKNNKTKQELKKKDYFSSKSNERLYIDMTRSKGYTDQLEKLMHDDRGVNLSLKVKSSYHKQNEAESNCPFTI